MKREDIHFMPQGNRDLSSKQIQKLKHSINKYGILRDVILIKTSLFGGKSKYYIIDGQHLFMAVESLNMLEDLEYKVCKYDFKSISEIVSFVATINSSQTPWKLQNYIEAYASTNLHLDYNKLIAKRIRYNLSFTLLAMVYGGLGQSAASNMLKEGKFKFVDEEKGDKVVKILQDVILLIGRSNSMTLNRFTTAFYNWYNAVNYDHKKFLKFIKKNIDRLLVLNPEGIELLLKEYK